MVDQKEQLEPFFKFLNGLTLATLIVAGLVLIAAVLLVVNTIRVAAFSRRRETGIMRLVGASNFYIQVPFLLEGAIAGLLGAALAAGLLVATYYFLVLGVFKPEFAFVELVGRLGHRAHDRADPARARHGDLRARLVPHAAPLPAGLIRGTRGRYGSSATGTIVARPLPHCTRPVTDVTAV